ncbi:MAG: hypothetical protein AAFU85_27915 [Planctomycetota bacterium]
MGQFTQFVPITLDLIDEGELKEQIEEGIAEAAKVLRAYRIKYGDDAKKAVASVKVKIGFCCVDPTQGLTAIVWDVDVARPKRPANLTSAMDMYDAEGRPALLVKAGGSDDEDPRQMKFSTADGRDVDAETGEVEPR